MFLNNVSDKIGDINNVKKGMAGTTFIGNITFKELKGI